MSGQNTRKERVCTEKTLEIIKVFFGYSLETWSIEKNNVAMERVTQKWSEKIILKNFIELEITPVLARESIKSQKWWASSRVLSRILHNLGSTISHWQKVALVLHSNDRYLYKRDEAEAICLWCSKQLRNLYVFVSLD